jgi:hypothetical protein
LEQELIREESALKKKVPQQSLSDKHLFIGMTDQACAGDQCR